MAEDRMLSDEVLLALINKNSGGGGGGTNNYNQLENKPQIAGTTLQGNKTLSELGIASETALGNVSNAVTAITNGQTINSFSAVETALSNKQDTLTFDNAPTENSNNPVKSGGVYSALAGKQDTLTAGDYISINASNEISVNRELTPHQTSYRIKGTGRDTMNITKYIDGVQESSTDYTYSQGTTRTIDDAFTINDTYSSAGYIWQFVWLKDSTTHDKDYTVEYRSYEGAFDFTEVFNDEDLSGYKLIIKSEMDTALSGKQDILTFDDVPTDNSNNPVKSNGIYDALALKQNATDNNLQTTDKTVVGAINEHEGDINSLKSGLINVNVALDVPEGTGKNVLPMTLAGIKSFNPSGTWDGNAYTYNGVTFTVQTDNDGNVTGISINGTASANIKMYIIQGLVTSDYIGKVLNGCPTGGSGSTYRLLVQEQASPYSEVGRDYGDGGVIGNTNIEYLQCFISINSGVSLTNAVFYPMIRPATITDPTFAPYIPSVDARLDAVESDLANKVIKKSTIIGTTDANGNIYNSHVLISKHVVLYVYVGADKTCSVFAGGGDTYNYHISSYTDWNVGSGVSIDGMIYYVEK